MSIPSTLASSACPTLPSPPRLNAVAPVRLLGAHVVWRMLWEAKRPERRQPAPQVVDLRDRLE
ncbi:hypothetical protein [Nocardioides astragali]|uniref:Uncharacterized protein n=1 Tax=Nocardioides astragali TaxID=1776736 RepID=A0ABW2N7L1_9ACTN|nr:hypothetical protein [Nocardioides astragali]